MSSLVWAQDDDIASCSAEERDAYLQAVTQAVSSHWQVAEIYRSVSCIAIIAQNFRGEVLDAGVEECNDVPEVEKALEDAVYRASPLPLPANRACFERVLSLKVSRRPD